MSFLPNTLRIQFLELLTTVKSTTSSPTYGHHVQLCANSITPVLLLHHALAQFYMVTFIPEER